MPFVDDLENRIRKLDMGAVECLLRKDGRAYAKYMETTRATICGRNALAILMTLLPEASRGALLNYDTSGRMTGDFSNSVSYVSAAFTLPVDAENPLMNANDAGLSPDEQKTLLRIARDTLNACARNQPLPDPEGGGTALTPKLKAKAGAFVTLKRRGQLRGCIGRIGYPELADDLPSLCKTIALMAVQSALHDHRFMPVKPDELDEIDIEISVLTIAHEVGGYEDFEVGRHGIIIRRGRRSAVFLPQVAPEQGWDRAETLNHLCGKAGLPENAWREPDMKFFVFTAQVFDESLLDE